MKAPVALHIHLSQPTEPAAAATPGCPDTPNMPPGVGRRRFCGDQGAGENPYPRRLMGVVAHLRQAMLDAEYHQNSSIWTEQPSIRTPYDPAVQTFWLAWGKKLPVCGRPKPATRSTGRRSRRRVRDHRRDRRRPRGRQGPRPAQGEHVAVILPLSFAEEPKVPPKKNTASGRCWNRKNHSSYWPIAATGGRNRSPPRLHWRRRESRSRSRPRV